MEDEDYCGEVGGLAPVNVIAASNTSSNDVYQQRCRTANIKPHPARFPAALPQFVIGLCTEPGDVILDPFAGSNTAGWVAEAMGRHWLAFEMEEEYLRGSQFRFETRYAKKEDTSADGADKAEVQPRLFERPTTE